MAPVQVDPFTFGRMVESLDNLTKVVSRMDEKLDSELNEIKVAVGRKTDMDDVKQELKEYGFDDPKETKKDAEFVRRERLKHENNTVLVTRVKQVVVTALILGALGWIGNAALDQIREDVQQEQHP